MNGVKRANNKIDHVVREVVDGQGDQWFTKPEAVNLICKNKKIGAVLGQLQKGGLQD